MDGGAPAGGRWNYDPENRKPLPKHIAPPPIPRFLPDAVTQEVIGAGAASGFGRAFWRCGRFRVPGHAARRREAALADFVLNRLPHFGDWQDTMKAGEATMFHALISSSLNTGLLDAAGLLAGRREQRTASGAAALNAVEGFVRQILGWREFVRGCLLDGRCRSMGG